MINNALVIIVVIVVVLSNTKLQILYKNEGGGGGGGGGVLLFIFQFELFPMRLFVSTYSLHAHRSPTFLGILYNDTELYY